MTTLRAVFVAAIGAMLGLALVVIDYQHQAIEILEVSCR